LTTYEVSASDFKLILKAKQVERLFFDRANTTRPNQKICASCHHWVNRCTFGFPEAGGTFADECDLFEQR